MIKITEEAFETFVQLTHLCNPIVTFIRDKGSKHYGKFWILDSNDNINGKYLTVYELYDFLRNNPNWIKEVAEPRIGKK